MSGIAKTVSSEQLEGDRDEPNRKYPDGGTMKSLPPPPEVPGIPPDPKLNLGVRVSAPRVSLVVVTVSRFPKLSKLSVDMVRVQVTRLEVIIINQITCYKNITTPG